MEARQYAPQIKAAELNRLTRETADRLKQTLAAGQPVTMKLIASSLADRLRDEHVIADLVQRSMAGDNAFADLVQRSMAGDNAFAALTREIIREEAEQIAQATLAAVESEAA
jgi:hypothetical protein